MCIFRMKIMDDIFIIFQGKPTNCTSDPIPTKLLKQYIDTVNFSLSNA